MASMKQMMAAKKLVGNGGNVTKAMRDVGYAEATVNTPQKLTKSKSWKAIMEQYFPDGLLAKKHQMLINKQEVVVRSYEGQNEIIKTGEIDKEAVKAGLDMAYKLKGKYAAEKIEIKRSAEFEELDREEQELAEEERQLMAENKRNSVKKNPNRKRKNKIRKGSKKGDVAVPAILPEPEVGGVHPDGGTE